MDASCVNPHVEASPQTAPTTAPSLVPARAPKKHQLDQRLHSVNIIQSSTLTPPCIRIHHLFCRHVDMEPKQQCIPQAFLTYMLAETAAALTDIDGGLVEEPSYISHLQKIIMWFVYLENPCLKEPTWTPSSSSFLYIYNNNDKTF